ncbi:hypothetical protein ACTG9Q_28750 [Actinokineospora sp. 24-640]
MVYLWVVGLDKADKWGSSIGGVVALMALGLPYLFPRKGKEGNVSENPGAGDAVEPNVVVVDSGDAEAEIGGNANSGAEVVEGDTTRVRVTRSGKSVAKGPGSVANSGVRRVPRS